MKLSSVVRSFLVLLVVLVGVAFPYKSVSAAAPTISSAVADPNMISLFGDNPSQTRGSPFGPSWTALKVTTTTPTTSVTAKVGTFLSDLLPSDAATQATSPTGWTSMITSMDSTALTQQGTTGVWVAILSIETLFAPLQSKFAPGVFRTMVVQGLRTGQKTITVTATNAADSTTTNSTITLWVVDAQILLRKGWNLRSTPMALADTKLTDILALGNRTSLINAALKYDPSKAPALQWQQLADISVSSLDGIYINAAEDTSIGARLLRAPAVAPASKALVRGAWNLIGTAPDFTDKDLFPLVTPDKMRGLLGVDVALNSVQSDWITAVSPGVGKADTSNAIAKTFTYTIGASPTTVGYTLGFMQPEWTFTKFTTDAVPTMTTYDATKTKGWTVPFGGYWVFIQSPMSGVTATTITLVGENQGILGEGYLLKLLTLGP